MSNLSFNEEEKVQDYDENIMDEIAQLIDSDDKKKFYKGEN